MSTSHTVRLGFCACLATVACSDGAPRLRNVSYAGLDEKLGSETPTPLVIGILGDATGPGASTGRPFLDVLRTTFEAASPIAGRTIQIHVFDDRSSTEGVRAASARFESDPGVAIAIVAPGAERAAVLAESAYRTPIVCVGCEDSAATREGTFVFRTADSSSAPTRAVEWILAAVGDSRVLDGRHIAAGLRTHVPPGATVVEGRATARDPNLFRDPKSASTRP